MLDACGQVHNECLETHGVKNVCRSVRKTRYKTRWVLKFEDGEYLYRDDTRRPKWGKKRKNAFPFTTRREARQTRKTWPKWCRSSIKVMRLRGIIQVGRVYGQYPTSINGKGLSDADVHLHLG